MNHDNYAQPEATKAFLAERARAVAGHGQQSETILQNGMDRLSKMEFKEDRIGKIARDLRQMEKKGMYISTGMLISYSIALAVITKFLT